jgi:hypothetical protein
MTDEPVRKIATYLPVSQEVLDDADVSRRFLDGVLARALAPAWTRPDDPFRRYKPDLTPRTTAAIAAIREAQSRITGAVEVLRYGVPEHEDDW